MYLTRKSSRLAAAVVALGHLASASSSQRNYTANDCVFEWNSTLTADDRPVNSSRTAPLDLGGDDDPCFPEGFAGSKEGNDTEFCMFMFPGVNQVNTAVGDDTNADFNATCNGVLSPACQDAMRNASQLVEGYNYCAGFGNTVSDASLAVNEACGNGMQAVVAPTFTTRELTGAEENCTVRDTIRRPDGVPDDYETMSMQVSILHTRYLDFTAAYDGYSRESIPVVMRVKSAGSDDFVSVLGCLPPDQVADGSRKPGGKFPHPALFEGEGEGNNGGISDDSNDDDSLAASWAPSRLGLAVVALTVYVGLVM
ncbi:hypothetical protein N3K66_000222 [Trichothecium roseum]|uniref:Uncharacterized protein n=1 Tax=Trichothecium roseum TaxID=47278 RepID=A0ACC0VD51_9HYPO|nr:hypothetical protein N3K66_000222 [Trichothecium roseum]